MGAGRWAMGMFWEILGWTLEHPAWSALTMVVVVVSVVFALPDPAP